MDWAELPLTILFHPNACPAQVQPIRLTGRVGVVVGLWRLLESSVGTKNTCYKPQARGANPLHRWSVFHDLIAIHNIRTTHDQRFDLSFQDDTFRASERTSHNSHAALELLLSDISISTLRERFFEPPLRCPPIPLARRYRKIITFYFVPLARCRCECYAKSFSTALLSMTKLYQGKGRFC